MPDGQSEAVSAWTYQGDDPSLPAGEYSHTTKSPPEQLAVAHPTLVVAAHRICEYALYVPVPTSMPEAPGWLNVLSVDMDVSTTHC